MIKNAFLNSLKVSIDSKELPLESGNLWSKHMLRCRKGDENLDFKISTYKKLGKFLTAMDKEGYIIYKEASKKHPTAQIIKINWNNEKLENFEPTIDCPRENEETGKKKNTENWQTNITIYETCEPKKRIQCFFDNYVEGKEYTLEDALKNLDNYLKKEKLIEKNMILINDDLVDNLGFEKGQEPQAEEKKEEGDQEDENKKKKEKTKKGDTVAMAPYALVVEKFQNAQDWLHIIKDSETQKSQTKKGKFKGQTITALYHLIKQASKNFKKF